MSQIKHKAHSILESILHNVAKSGENRGSIMTIPYYELVKELGFGEPGPGQNIELTISAEFIDDEGETYETGTQKSTSKNQTRN